ncbi:hypothetical protein WICPIJ_001414 [Wickerhamomyces pijperi]|uniref:Uncharacterized protein n=1 Tax=Wickerhamomyces pijperi TaxID=599730 RepID=A0A9P8TQT6_WICPI|nr:hypothetical protein WICPIJ_001414 [Wickerhamomyces pijperi]
MPTIQQDKNFTKKVVTTLTLILSIYTNFKYSLGRSPSVIKALISKDDPTDDPFYRIGFTPFTGNLLLLIIFWGFTHFFQILYVSKIYNDEETTTSDSKVEDWSWLGFSGFNLLQSLWSVLFGHGHYILSEIVVIANFIHVLILYFSLQSYKYSVTDLSKYILTHGTVVALPLSWLMYVIFWNGAVIIGSNGLAFRIVCNVLIWQFLIIPMFFLVIFRDWLTGLSVAYITAAVGLGQLFTKMFALQWIFAFAISAALLFSSIAVWSGNLGRSDGAVTAAGRETEPLIG